MNPSTCNASYLLCIHASPLFQLEMLSRESLPNEKEADFLEKCIKALIIRSRGLLTCLRNSALPVPFIGQNGDLFA